MRIIISLLITLVFSNYILSTPIISDANAQAALPPETNPLEACPSPFEFVRIDQFQDNIINCSVTESVDSMSEGEDRVMEGSDACSGVGLFSGFASQDFTSAGPIPDSFSVRMFCNIPFDTSETVLCPTGDSFVFFNETERTDQFLNCQADVFSISQVEGQETLDDAVAFCDSTPNAISSTEILDFTTSGITFFSGNVNCEIAIPSTLTVISPETNPLESCPSPFGFQGVNTFDQGGQITCNLNEIVETLPEAQAIETQGRDACFGVGIFSGGAIGQAITSGPDTGSFRTIMSCNIPFDTSQTVLCPTDNSSIFFAETDRTDQLLNCQTGLIGNTQAEIQDTVDDAVAFCDAIPNTISSTEFIDVTTNGDFVLFVRGNVNCDIALISPPEFGPFRNGVELRACDASCTRDIRQTRVCINGNIGDPGCIGRTTRDITLRCTTGSQGLCPAITTAPIINLILEDD